MTKRLHHTPGLIVLPSGKLIDILNPQEDDFDIFDIAHSLAMKCRWGGSAKQFYSVAQHSVYASFMVPPPKAKAALLHDATETYLDDLRRPVKMLLPAYKALEDKLGAQIALSFGLPVTAFDDPEVHHADDRLQMLEATVLINTSEGFWQAVGGRPDGSIFDVDTKFRCWGPEEAKRAMLHRYFEIRGEGF